MKLFTFCRLLVVISVGAVLVQGCSKNSGAGDTTEDTERAYLRSQLKSCVSNTDYDSSLDYYIIHSRWYTITESTKCTSGDDDAKAACWKDALDDILPEHHTMHAPIRRCIDTYKTAAAGLMKKRVLRSSDETLQRATREVVLPDLADMVRCPKTSVAQFKSKMESDWSYNVILGNLLPDDTTLTGFETLANAFQNTFTCSKDFCDCTSIDSTFNSLFSTNFTGSHCNTCWYLKLADSTKGDISEGYLTIKYLFSFAAVSLTDETSIVCTPQTRIVLSLGDAFDMGITQSADINQFYLGKLEACYPDDPNATATAELDDKCKATMGIGAGGKYAEFNVATDKCSLDTDREIITDENDISYHKFKYFVTKIPTIDEANPVQRYSCAEKEFECLIPVNQTLTTGVVTPEIHHINSTKVEGESAYQLDFTIDTSSPVEVGQNISVAISLVNVVTPANYRLTATNCFAKPEDNSQEYPIINCHGCKANNTYDGPGDITLTSNGVVGDDVEFTFKAFTWTNKTAAEQKIFIHCDVNVCDNVAETCGAATSCPTTDACPTKRFRRGLPTTDDTRVSFGPILVKRKSEGIVHPHKTFTVML